MLSLGVVGEVWFAVLDLRSSDQWPSGTDGVFIASYLPMAYGVLSLTRQRSDRPAFGTLLDAAIVTTGVGLLALVFVIGPLVADGSQSVPARVVGSLYLLQGPRPDRVTRRLCTWIRSLMVAMRAVAPPFGLSAVAEAAALAALADPEHTTQIVSSVRERREAFQKALRTRGVQIPESESNFVFIPAAEQVRELELACASKGVAVRAFADEGVRVTVGYPEAEAAVLEAVDLLRPRKSE